MGPIGCPETSVRKYHSTPRKIPEELRFHLHRGGSLNSFMACYRVTLTFLFLPVDFSGQANTYLGSYLGTVHCHSMAACW
jgi:hypothetical protein